MLSAATPNFSQEVALAVSMEYQACVLLIFPGLNLDCQARRRAIRVRALDRQRFPERAADTVFTGRQSFVADNEFKRNVRNHDLGPTGRLLKRRPLQMR